MGYQPFQFHSVLRTSELDVLEMGITIFLEFFLCSDRIQEMEMRCALLVKQACVRFPCFKVLVTMCYMSILDVLLAYLDCPFILLDSLKAIR